jgi:ABC-type lipoprotein release transport system permease subunit
VLVLKTLQAKPLHGYAIALRLEQLSENVLKVVSLRNDARDAATFTLVAFSIAIAGFIAAWIPARRAPRIDPVHALRIE